MWIVEGRNIEWLLQFWLAIRRRVGTQWEPLAGKLGHPMCRLVSLPDSHAALLDEWKDGETKEWDELLEKFGARRIDQQPEESHLPDLSEALKRVALKPAAEPERVPPLVQILAPDQQRIADYVRGLMLYEHDEIRLATGKMIGGRKGWLIAIEGLRSITPLKPHFRDQWLSGSRVFLPLDSSVRMARPAGFYIEWGHKSPIEAFLPELWQTYGGKSREHIVLRGDKSCLDVMAAGFRPVDELVDLVFDPDLELADYLPAEGNVQLQPIELRIERVPYPERVPLSVERRRTIDQIYVLKSKLERLDIELAASEPQKTGRRGATEPLVLVRVPQSAEPSLLEVLRRTPDDVLGNFLYFGRRCQGERSHFFYPRADAACRTFPGVCGATELYCWNEWRRMGLHLFLSEDLRMTPHLHPSQARKIREALFGGYSANGLGALPIFAFWLDAQESPCHYILPDPAQGFVSLPKALNYVNGCQLSGEPNDVLKDTADSFCSSLSDWLDKATVTLDSEEDKFVRATENFYGTATKNMNDSFGELKLLQTDIDSLAKRIAEIRKKADAIERNVETSLSPSEAPWSTVLEQLDTLQAEISELSHKKSQDP